MATNLLTVLGLNDFPMYCKFSVKVESGGIQDEKRNKKGGFASCSGTVNLLVIVLEFNVGCNYISAEKLLSHETTSRFTLISGAADKVTSPTLIWKKESKARQHLRSSRRHERR